MSIQPNNPYSFPIGSKVMHLHIPGLGPGHIVAIEKAGYRVLWIGRPAWHEDLVYPHEIRLMNGLEEMLELLP